MGRAASQGRFIMSYSSFNEFREKIAKSIGFDMNEFQGFGGKRSWNEMKSPIKALINHSDCAGDLTVEEMKPLIPELEKVLLTWEDSWFKTCLAELIESMQLAIKSKQPLEFQ